MMQILINIIVILTIPLLFLTVYYKQKKYRIVTKRMINFLSKNIEFLNDIYRKKEVHEIKKNIQLYTQCQVISNVAKCDYVSYFKYNYNKNHASLNFLFTIDKNSLIVDTLLYEFGNNILNLKSLKFKSDKLYYIDINEIKNINEGVYKSMLYKGTNKIYYQNIYKNSSNPVGFIAISYKDINYNIPNCDEKEILRMINKIKNII